MGAFKKVFKGHKKLGKKSFFSELFAQMSFCVGDREYLKIKIFSILNFCPEWANPVLVVFLKPLFRSRGHQCQWDLYSDYSVLNVVLLTKSEVTKPNVKVYAFFALEFFGGLVKGTIGCQHVKCL